MVRRRSSPAVLRQAPRGRVLSANLVMHGPPFPEFAGVTPAQSGISCACRRRSCHGARGILPCAPLRARPSSQSPQPAHLRRPLISAHGSGGFLSSSSSLARSSAQVSRSHLRLDSRLSQRGFLIKPTVNQSNLGRRLPVSPRGYPATTAFSSLNPGIGGIDSVIAVAGVHKVKPCS